MQIVTIDEYNQMYVPIDNYMERQDHRKQIYRTDNKQIKHDYDRYNHYEEIESKLDIEYIFGNK